MPAVSELVGIMVGGANILGGQEDGEENCEETWKKRGVAAEQRHYEERMRKAKASRKRA